MTETITRRTVNVQLAEENLKRARAALEKAYKRSQARCKHPIECVVEGRHIHHEGNFIDGHIPATPPFRVCMRCGYAEEGWGCGYMKLHYRGEVMKVKREEAVKFIHGGIRKQEELDKVRFKK